MLEHHRRMHEQGNDQYVREISPDESKLTIPDAKIHGDEAPQQLANFPARMHHSTDVDKVPAVNSTVDQALGHTAKTTASTQKDDTATNAALNTLRIELDRLQKAKEQAMRDLDRDINNVMIALKVVEKTRHSFTVSPFNS